MATRTRRRSRASRAARSRDRALPADPRGHRRRAPARRASSAIWPTSPGCCSSGASRADGLHEQLTFASERVTAALPSPSEERWVDRPRRRRQRAPRALRDRRRLAARSCRSRTIPTRSTCRARSRPTARASRSPTPGRNGVDFDVAVVALDGGERRELAQPGGWSHVADWSEHGILVQRANTPFDHDLFLVDPETGALDAPHAARRRGRLRLGRACCPTAACCAPATPAASSRGWRCCARAPSPSCCTPDDADVEIVALDATRTRRAWAINRDGESEVWLDGTRLDGLPGGVVSALAFAPDGALTDHGRAARRLDRRLERGARPCSGARARRSADSTAAASCGRCSTRSRASTAAASRTCASGRRGGPTLCWVHGGPESQFRPQMAARDPVPVRAGHHGRRAQRARLDRLRAHAITTSTTSSGGSTRSPTSPRSARALGAGADTPVGVMGGSYGGYMTMAAITEHPDALGVRREHRRHRQLRHVPRAHGRLPPRAARGRVRLARARPRVPRVDLADPQDRRASPAR